jgi:hypothetical protein
MFLLSFAPLSYGNETLKNDKIDSIKSQQILNEYDDLWAKFKKEDPTSDYKHVTKKFVTNYILNIFFTPSVSGNIIIIIQNDKGEIVLKQDAFLNQGKPQLDYEVLDDSILISYQTRIGRNVGPGLSLTEYERRVEFINPKQITIIKLEGDVENHSFGEKKAAYSFYKDQKSECILKTNEITLNYEYKLWNHTGAYQDDSFTQKVKPDEQKKYSIYFKVVDNELKYDQKRSERIDYKQEVIKYQ